MNLFSEHIASETKIVWNFHVDQQLSDQQLNSARNVDHKLTVYSKCVYNFITHFFALSFSYSAIVYVRREISTYDLRLAINVGKKLLEFWIW